VAGGMMNTSYVALPATLTAQATIDRLRQLAPPAEEISYVYVITEEGKLIGALSLRDLIVAPPKSSLSDIIADQGEAVHVPADTPLDDVIRVIEKYNLLAVPVTDEEERLVGVITVDDAIEELLSEEGRRGLLRGRQ